LPVGLSCPRRKAGGTGPVVPAIRFQSLTQRKKVRTAASLWLASFRFKSGPAVPLFLFRKEGLGRTASSLPSARVLPDRQGRVRRRPSMARPVRNPASLEPAPTHTHPLIGAA
jgi:hypothetical protein